MKSIQLILLSCLVVAGAAALSHADDRASRAGLYVSTVTVPPSTGTVPSPTPSYSCPDLRVSITNTTEHRIVGGIWGNTGNLGSGGYVVEPYGSSPFGLPSSGYPQGTSYGVTGVIQLVDNTDSVFFTCNVNVPGVNGCPDPAISTQMIILDTGNGLGCQMRAR